MDYEFVPEAKANFIDEERYEKYLAEQTALAEFVKANPTLDETSVKLAEFIVALKGTI